MMLGTVRELWRYPVKSMGGEQLSTAEVVATFGIPGDRGWAVRDEESGEIKGAKKIGALMGLAARYVAEPVGADTPAVEIEVADNRWVRSDDPQISALISDAIKRDVTLWPRQPVTSGEHYRRVEAMDEAEIRRQLGLLANDPMPDYASRSTPERMAELSQYVSPRGTYFDAYELHLLTTASLATLARLTPDSTIDVRRFRPNIVVDIADNGGEGVDPGFPERGWVGRTLRIGTVVVHVDAPMSRCVMVTLPQGDLPRDRSIMRTLVRETGMDLGAAVSIVQAGRIRVGDTITRID